MQVVETVASKGSSEVRTKNMIKPSSTSSGLLIDPVCHFCFYLQGITPERKKSSG